MTCEATHCPYTASVRFAIYPGGFDGPRIIARVSDDALCQRFGASGDEASLIEACQRHFALIEAKALERHHAAPTRPVLLSIGDFATPKQAAAEAPCA